MKKLIIISTLILSGCATTESTIDKTNVIVNSKTKTETNYPSEQFLSKCGWLEDIDTLYVDLAKREKDYETLSQCKIKQETLSKFIRQLKNQDKNENK